MPRAPRLLLEDQPAVYHVMSRTALDGFPFDAADKDHLLALIKLFGAMYFCQILGFALMGNHFHLLVRMLPAEHVDDDDVIVRFRRRYGHDTHPNLTQIEALRQKWTSLSEFMRELKQTFSRYYNARHHRRGTLWGERFKSVLVEDGRTLVNCLAYIDLNPVRAGLVDRPEDYRWCSLGYHLQSGNRDNLLTTDFGMMEWGIGDDADTLRYYRQFLYETGAVDVGKGNVLAPEIVDRARQADYEYSYTDRFILRTRWFTDSGIIGSKSFVAAISRRFGLPGAVQREPQKVSGIDFYSLKRLAENL
ncbi:transposase [Desulfovibrio inopinatus]|uniref:transposase n=1 Tax=Desulfovibrio inopinatus TaxID=102109 RepID=UPI0004130C74|nr:transposase [Desulfovibrio inopinatus]